jgi:hypothetical protein
MEVVGAMTDVFGKWLYDSPVWYLENHAIIWCKTIKKKE